MRHTSFNYSEEQKPSEQALSDIDGLCAFGTWHDRFFKNFVIGEDGCRIYSYHTEFRLTPAGELLSGVTLSIFRDVLDREKRRSGFIGFIAGDHPLGSLSVVRTAVG